MKHIITAIIYIIIICNMPEIYANEINKSVTNLSMSNIENSDADIEFITDECKDETIECFAVGENNIAIGLTNQINIYDLDGNFIYGIKCYISSAYFLEYSKNDLFIYMHRSSKCIKITGYKEPLSYYSVDDTNSNYDIISYKLKNRNQYIIKDDNIYKIRGITDTKLVKINKDQTETIIYNSSTNVFMKFIVVFIGVIMFAFIILYNIIIKI
ncbi:hypothetical protein [Porcipelethomonas sp.]|uniref:hypothetical protein n=1 Tax=Porcipelethomonas sp. TaxID=2981675 RepID=UPI003EF8766C